VTSVSFYTLEGVQEAQQRLLFACRLTNKAYRSGLSVLIHTANAEQTATMDKLLWEAPASSFLPHGTSGKDQERVRIDHSDEPGSHDSLLINLSTGVPGFCSRFERIFEIVVFDPDIHAQTRENYKFYKDRGFPLSLHKITPAGDATAYANA
jgi:DNA polymerase-3 subunit chi